MSFEKDFPSLKGKLKSTEDIISINGWPEKWEYSFIDKDDVRFKCIDKKRLIESLEIIKRRQRQWYDEYIIPILFKLGITKKELGIKVVDFSPQY